MFVTPPHKMETRSAVLKKQNVMKVEQKREVQSEKIEQLRKTVTEVPQRPQTDLSAPSVKCKESTVSSKKKLSSRSTIARRIQLELEAAQAKAKIEKDLIDMKLAADIAALEECSQKSCRSQSSSNTNRKVEQWLERSVLDAPELPCPDGRQLPAVAALAAPTDIQLLACALKDTIKATAKEVKNETLLSRLSTSKDLPLYYGDPLEWLQFRNSYLETTKLCKYTDTENLWRLTKCLRGEARSAVSSLLIGNTSPAKIIEALELRFGRPEFIMLKLVSQLKKIPPLPMTYHNEIVNFAIKIENFVAAVQAIQQSDYLRSPDTLTAVISKCPSTLICKWTDYLFNHSDENKAKLVLFSEFLNTEATRTAAAGISHIYSQTDHKKKHEERNKFVHTTVDEVVATTTTTKCKFCRKSAHQLTECTMFKKAMRRNRWNFARTNKLCYKCLAARHGSESCPADNCDVDGCGLPHHRLLHYKKPTSDTQECETADTVAHTTTNAQPKVLLKIVPITVHGPKGSIMTHALLDDGATVTLISADIAEQAGLRGETSTMRVNSAWDSAELVCAVENVNFTVSNSDGERFDLKARKMNELNLPVQSMSDICKYKHVRECNSLHIYKSDIKPKLLIGQDNYNLIAPIKCISGRKNEPYITQTSLGWCVHGIVCSINGVNNKPSLSSRGQSMQCKCNTTSELPVSSAHDSPTESRPPGLSSPPRTCDAILYINNDALFHEEMKRSFAIDAIGITCQPRQNENDKRAISILEKTAKLVDQRWEVGLPWKSEDKMPDSYPNAYRRLRCIENKMRSNEAYALRYKERVNHLFSNNFAKNLIDDETAKRIWYLPHFGVDNPNKKKLRLVFDAAATSGGQSLNDYLLQGPDLLQSLLGIMMRFREYPVAVIGDIKDMFLQIKIISEDQHALRFLWRDNPNDPIRKYVMTSLIFGANCSPFIAQYIKNKNAMRFQDVMPDAVETILKNHYMDDCIESFKDASTAVKIINEVIQIHKQGGFLIHNWMSNCEEVLKNIPKETLKQDAVRFKMDSQPERALGLMWYPGSDTLTFDLSLKRIPTDILSLKRRPTKREVLQVIMSVFDIHGMLAPFTIKAKILMQKIWKTTIKWDQEITDELNTYFREWLNQLQIIKNVHIPRWYFRTLTEGSYLPATDYSMDVPAHTQNEHCVFQLELHVFCDASPAAYAAVGYFRKVTQNEHGICVSFIASKARVAPVKPLSVPRLELQAAVLGCRLAETIQREHRFKIDKRYFWTDSSTVLHWINNNTRTYKTFIANRLGEIDTLTNAHEWNYVPTEMNIADVATKRNNYILTSDCEWFTGPSFLYKSCDQWPSSEQYTQHINDDILETVHTVCNVFEKENLSIPDPSRFSSWIRLLRSTACVFLFIEKCRKNYRHKNIDRELLDKAETMLLRYSQQQCFYEEICRIRLNKAIDRHSRLLTLTPVLCGDGLLRVDGRIGAAKNIPVEIKNPIILDGRTHIARLIVKHYHERAAHSSNEMVVNELRQKYWILKLRPTVRTVAARCLICRKRKITPKAPRLGDLPEARLSHHQRPFTHCGIDLFGPFEVTVGRQKPKRYGVIFTCMTVRAVHIEIVHSLTTDALIMALRRMAARRGWPQRIYSDNGTNLRGADTELRKAYLEIFAEDAVQSEIVNRGVDWHFISPASPHMGGAWERLIRSIKNALRVILKERAPREEVFSTLMVEVENIINSRPLTHVSVDPTSGEALTPNHFLIGSSSNLPVAGVFSDDEFYLRRQWRIAQRLSDMFWQRWVREVLPVLLPRQKWCYDEKPLQPGDIVVVVDPNTPRNSWPMGMIEKVYPGKDGRVRVVDVKTKKGVMKRPVTRVALLPTSGECRQSDTGAEDVDDAPRS